MGVFLYPVKLKKVIKMAKSNLTIEIDRGSLSKEAFDLIKNDVVKNILADALVSDDEASWHVKAEYNRHSKVKVDISGMVGGNPFELIPSDFDPATIENLERIKLTLEDIE